MTLVWLHPVKEVATVFHWDRRLYDDHSHCEERRGKLLQPLRFSGNGPVETLVIPLEVVIALVTQTTTQMTCRTDYGHKQPLQ